MDKGVLLPEFKRVRIMASFDYDIFISYSPLDNQPLTEEDSFQWITEFHKDLSARLARYTGQIPRIWREEFTEGTTAVKSTKQTKALEKTAILLSIFSPSYVKSETGEQELKAFYAHAESTTGIRIKNKSRILKVIKTPLASQEDFLPEVRSATGYHFYRTDENHKVREYDKSLHPETKIDYFLLLDDLAQDIYQLLGELSQQQTNRTDSEEEEKTAESSKKPIAYLALPPSDLVGYYQQIKRELHSRGYGVVPRFELHGTRSERTEAIKNSLNQAALTIHFFGEVYDENAHLQNDVAAEYAAETNLQRLIWIPRTILDAVNSGGKGPEPKQADFLSHLQKDDHMLQGAQLMSESLDLMTADMLVRLRTLERLHFTEAVLPKPLVETVVPKHVYVMGSPHDLQALKDLKKQLLALGVEVRLARHASDGTLQKDHYQRALRQYDAVLVYWDSQEEDELEDTLDTINLTLSAVQRTTPLLSRVVLLAGASTEEKKEFTTTSFKVLDGTDGISEAVLEPLLHDLNAPR